MTAELNEMVQYSPSLIVLLIQELYNDLVLGVRSKFMQLLLEVQ